MRRYPNPAPWRLAAECPVCGRGLRLRRRREDRRPFIGCAGYPSCKFAEDYDEVLVAIVAERDRLRREQDSLLEYATTLEDELEEARSEKGADVSRELKALVYRWHPDRHPEAIPPGEVVGELLRLREAVAS